MVELDPVEHSARSALELDATVGAEAGELGSRLAAVVFELDHAIALKAVVVPGAATISYAGRRVAATVILKGLFVLSRAGL